MKDMKSLESMGDGANRVLFSGEIAVAGGGDDKLIQNIEFYIDALEKERSTLLK